MKPFHTTLILVLLAAAVGGYIWFNERGPVAEQGSTVLLRTDPARVRQVSLRGSDDKTIELQKNGDEWKVLEKSSDKVESTPAVPADEEAVENLLDQIQLLQSSNITTVGESKLQDYGLDKPAGRVVIDGTEIQVGTAPSFDPSRVYARIGDRVALLSSALNDAIARPFDEWRDKAALRVETDKATKLVIQSPELNATFSGQKQQEAGEPPVWTITQPIAGKADSSAVNSFISQLSLTTAERFLDDAPKDLKSWGLDKPQATIAVTDGDGESMLKIGRKTQNGFAAQNSTSPSVFEISATAFDLANRPLKDWRSKQVADIDFDTVNRIKVKARDGSRTLEEKDNKWQLAGGQAEDAMHQASFDILLNLQGLQAQDFIDNPQAPATYGLDKPQVEFVLNKQTIQLSTLGGKTYACAPQKGETVYEVPQSTLDSFRQALDTLFKN